MFNLIPWGTGRKANPFTLMKREFDNVFDRLFGGAAAETRWGLKVDDAGKEVVVRVEAPGFEAKDFDVEVSGGLLTVRAEHKDGDRKDEEGGQRWLRLERSVTLPEGLDLDKVEATYRNGVLELRLPKHPDALPRRVEVKA
jgi:HSP20 family protein